MLKIEGVKKMKKYIKLMRPKHYFKNLLIFAPLLFSANLFNLEMFASTLLGFIAFSLIASSVYIINDIQDVEKDRKHPTKCKRPLASGEIKKGRAKFLTVLLIIVATVINYFVATDVVMVMVWMYLYLAINIAYSSGLKNIPIIDVVILVLGFVIRVLYGSEITGIEISNWLYLTVISMSFYLSLGKRRNELIRQQSGTRDVLKYYTKDFLDKNMYVSLGLTIAFYALWTVDPITLERFSGNALIWTVPLVIVTCMKYSLNVEGDSEGDPVEVLFGDKLLVGLVGFYAIVTGIIIYL